MIFNMTKPVMDTLPQFTYTGTYEFIDDGGGNWRIKFLSSGVFTPLKDMTIDVFLVGAGGGGSGRGDGSTDWPILSGASGGGGYTTTVKLVTLTKNVEYTITIGEGGAPYYSSTNTRGAGTAGGNTSAFGTTVEGGKAGNTSTGGGGGNGGSGGSYGGAEPGSDGADGGSTSTSLIGGKGQGTTTREFRESSGDLYSGGGASTASRSTTGTGADGGGGDVNDNGTPNTGGGGGSPISKGVGYGGSGIVIIRKHKEAAA